MRRTRSEWFPQVEPGLSAPDLPREGGSADLALALELQEQSIAAIRRELGSELDRLAAGVGLMACLGPDGRPAPPR